MIIGSIYVCVIGFVSTFSTFAIFVISCSSFKSPTFTLNSIFFVSPAFRLTCIPSSIFPVYGTPSIFKLSVTYVVPVGIVSCALTCVGAVPLLLSKFIVYVIISSFFTFEPSGGFADFVNFKSALFTMLETWFVKFPSTVAWFVIVFVKFVPCNSFTITSNDTVTFPLFGTSTFIPLFKLFSSYSGFETPFSFMLPFTKLVPSGVWSTTETVFPKSPSFIISIVYVIFSPSTT